MHVNFIKNCVAFGKDKDRLSTSQNYSDPTFNVGAGKSVCRVFGEIRRAEFLWGWGGGVGSGIKFLEYETAHFG